MLADDEPLLPPDPELDPEPDADDDAPPDEAAALVVVEPDELSAASPLADAVVETDVSVAVLPPVAAACSFSRMLIVPLLIPPEDAEPDEVLGSVVATAGVASATTLDAAGEDVESADAVCFNKLVRSMLLAALPLMLDTDIRNSNHKTGRAIAAVCPISGCFCGATALHFVISLGSNSLMTNLPEARGLCRET